MDEEEIWKCRKHPLKRRSSGVCPFCLRDRLIHLCPDCANVRPCSCCYSSSSSSTSSSFSLSSSIDAPKSNAGIGVRTVGPVSNLIDCDPAFRRSRSTTFSFIGRRPADKDAETPFPPAVSRTRSSFWPVLKCANKMKKAEQVKDDKENLQVEKMMRSKSVGISSLSESTGADSKSRSRRWYFPSPMKVFRQPKTTKVVQDQSPLCSG